MAKMFTLIGGCNGAGKSSYASLHYPNADFINPDAIQEERGLTSFAVGRVVVDLVSEKLRGEPDFVLETTFSDRRGLKLLQAAKRLGWCTRLVFIGLDSMELHKKRVAIRVRKGGHVISDELIERRYPRALENLGLGFELADEVLVMDNSGATYQDIVHVLGGCISNRFPHMESGGNLVQQITKLLVNSGKLA